MIDMVQINHKTTTTFNKSGNKYMTPTMYIIYEKTDV